MHEWVNFRPDIEPDNADDEVCVTLEDPRLALGEEAYQLEIEQEIDDLGTYAIYYPFDLRPIVLIRSQDRGFFP